MFVKPAPFEIAANHKLLGSPEIFRLHNDLIKLLSKSNRIINKILDIREVDFCKNRIVDVPYLEELLIDVENDKFTN